MSSFKSTQFFAVATKLRRLLEDVETQFDVDAEVPEKEDTLGGLEAEIAAVVEKMSEEEKECITKALEILKKYSDTESEEETDETEFEADEEPEMEDADADKNIEAESKEVAKGEALEEKRKKAKKAKKDADE